MDLSKFKFKTEVRVRNYEVDWQGIVHNANYLLYFEVGRIEYLRHVGVEVNINTIQNDSKVVLVRNEINYNAPAQFDDILNVHTRIMYIKNTSFAFEGALENARTKKRIGENIAVHVWLDARTERPTRVNDKFRTIIQEFEGNNLIIVNPAAMT